MKDTKKRKVNLSYEKRRTLFSFIFILPFIIGFLVFFLVPLIDTFRLSFKADYGAFTEPVGFSNYKMLFQNRVFKIGGKDYPFLRIITESVLKIAIELPLITIFSLIIAVILNQKFKGQGIARTIFLLPIIFSSGIVFLLTSGNQSSNYYNFIIEGQSLYKTFNFDYLFISKIIPENIVLGMEKFIFKIFEIVAFSGVQILIFLSALQSINPTLYEVGKIEGASPYVAFWKITMPQITPVIMTTIIYTFVDILYRSPMTLALNQISQESHPKGGFGFASAIAVIFLILTIILLVIILLLVKGIEKSGKEKIRRK